MKDRKNLEEQLADKLGNRSITPSEQAWERIAHNRQLGKSKKKKVALYYVAAIALFLLSTGYGFRILINDNSIITDVPQVVQSDKTDAIIETAKPDAMPQMALPGHQQETVVYEERKKQVITLQPANEKVETIAVANQNIRVNENLLQPKVWSLSETKVVAKNKNYEEEVAVLLKEATKEIAANKQLSAPTNDTALLKEAEAEMNEYYRDKAMRIFSLKYKTIRVAVKDQ